MHMLSLERKNRRIFYTCIDLPQGSSSSPYLFTVYHCDLDACVGVHFCHIVTDDLNVLISSQVQDPIVDIYMEGKKLEVVKEFKYLGFTWTDKMSLKPRSKRRSKTFKERFVN